MTDLIDQILILAGISDGRVFGDYVRNIIVPKTLDIKFGIINIWFPNQNDRDSFVNDVEFYILDTVLDFQEKSEFRIKPGSQYCKYGRTRYQLLKDQIFIATIDIVVSKFMPADDFDVDCLTYHYKDGHKIAESFSDDYDIETLINKIQKKTASILYDEFYKIVNHPDHIDEFVTQVNDYLNKSWTLTFMNIPFNEIVEQIDDYLSKSRILNYMVSPFPDHIDTHWVRNVFIPTSLKYINGHYLSDGDNHPYKRMINLADKLFKSTKLISLNLPNVNNNILIEDILRLAGTCYGRVFGQYVRDVIVPENYDDNKIYDIDIWFTTLGDSFVFENHLYSLRKVIGNILFYPRRRKFECPTLMVHKIITPKDDINSYTRYDWSCYKLWKRDKVIANVNVIVSDICPSIDFDVNRLTYRYYNDYKEPESFTELTTSELITSIMNKQAKLLPDYNMDIRKSYICGDQRTLEEYPDVQCITRFTNYINSDYIGWCLSYENGNFFPENITNDWTITHIKFTTIKSSLPDNIPKITNKNLGIMDDIESGYIPKMCDQQRKMIVINQDQQMTINDHVHSDNQQESCIIS